jgi:chitin disaccharide deacetylase
MNMKRQAIFGSAVCIAAACILTLQAADRGNGHSERGPGDAETAATAGSGPGAADGVESIRVLMRADDFGFSHSANLACIHAYREGILRSVEVLVPGPWFLEAADLLAENPGLDAGVHLCLTCEWDNYRWQPLTGASGLLTKDGFLPLTDGDFNGLAVSAGDAEREFRAQIERALKHMPRISHLSTHMGAPTSRPELIALIDRLSKEYGLPADPAGAERWDGGWGEPVDRKEDYLADFLQSCGPGLSVFVCHLALNDVEAAAIRGSGHDAMVRMAAHRQAETDAVTSERVKRIVRERGIRLVSYADTFVAGR